MEWDDLRHFLAVARTGSLRNAARQLKTSPATVGRRVAALERQLGARVFDRSRTGYALTETGEAVRTKAEVVEEAALALEREVLGRDLRPSGKVRLTTTSDIATLVVGPNLAEFRRRYPEIVLEIIANPDIANLTRREADIALRTVRPRQADVVVRRAGWWNLGLYAGRGYATAHGLKPGMKEIPECEIITWNEEVVDRRGGPWFAQHVRKSTIALAANTRPIHLAACKAGLGLAILPDLMARNDRDLVCLLPPQQVVSVELWLVVHRDLVRTARVRAVMDFLAAVCPRTTEAVAGRSMARQPDNR